MKTDTDVLDIYRRVFDDLPEADVASVIATLRGVAAAADVDTAVAILKADDFCGDDAQLRQDAEAIREAFAQVSDAERVRELEARVAALESALDDGISIVMDFAPGHDGWLDNAARLLENTIEAADAAKGRG